MIAVGWVLVIGLPLAVLVGDVAAPVTLPAIVIGFSAVTTRYPRERGCGRPLGEGWAGGSRRPSPRNSVHTCTPIL
ncbi:Uncharacterised protein [Nocardia cyriacigeorgica]|uniref:Uncharacterized protein n=1 Tax=Nocardia cyriacigeorgica TaxID=135487 RepID=A0A4U8W7I5_9NOCA|nr:Uncharacterised protein [Nocardia cyriacigeorgica]